MNAHLMSTMVLSRDIGVTSATLVVCTDLCSSWAIKLVMQDHLCITFQSYQLGSTSGMARMKSVGSHTSLQQLQNSTSHIPAKTDQDLVWDTS
jgi:hypothetical protein